MPLYMMWLGTGIYTQKKMAMSAPENSRLMKSISSLTLSINLPVKFSMIPRLAVKAPPRNVDYMIKCEGNHVQCVYHACSSELFVLSW